ncbi:DUF6090 family protein [Flavobacteriaceae bacterium S0862]|nr:DUF6090 family protein [Flavobacteriaceae bacterium S0862]
MIKLFRKIRQNLLMENKTGKYFKYAIGEIVLVVIGILIALGINNWNQENKDNKLSKEYLSRIHRDLVQDTTSFRDIIKSNKKLRNDIKEVLVVLYQENITKEQVKKIAVVYDNVTEQVFSSNQNTYNGMINSGALQLIQNLELKEAIINVYSEYDEKRELFLGNTKWIIDILSTETVSTDFIKLSPEVLDIFTTEEMLNHDDWSFLNNKKDEEFKLIVRAFSAAAWNQKISDGYYVELISSIKIVLQLLEKELK